MLRKGTNDTVFQLSLTELAFVLTFMVLLLIGSKFLLVDKDAAACEQEKNRCYAQLPVVLGDPQEAIDTLVNAPKLKAENTELKAALAEKEARLKAIEKLEVQGADPVRTAKALEFLKGYEQTARQEIAPERAVEEGKKVADTAKKTAGLEKELENCRGQLKHCVTVTGAPKGYGHPPCWTDAAGRIEYLFEVEIRSEGVRVTPAWPIHREEYAEALPGAKAAIQAGVQSLEKFRDTTRGIFDLSRRANPECRYYVILKRHPALTDLDQFNTTRLGVEDFFYKLDRTGVATR
ncbi:MAG: hypothetical protein WD823_12215 [Sulfuricaulis sp.]|uniref:hypothetical protein n=1 Tax=Sulfuricaulis sp. TaxID=2003553 RepID=UPI0034A2FB96